MTIADQRPVAPLAEHADAATVARWARLLRIRMIEVVGRVGEGYLQQGLGAAEIFAAVYLATVRTDPADPQHPGRDRFLLSTAHNSVAMYAALAERGVLPAAELERYGQDGSALEIISSERVPGVEATFGSLGQAISVGTGLALSARLRRQSWRVYVVLGDGEMQEGQTWEAAMAASAHRLDNLTVVLDLNQMQVGGATSEVLEMGDATAKWRAFGWHVAEVDGNDPAQLLAALSAARATTGRPQLIVARTEPGHPISFLRGRREHYAKLSPEETSRALAELSGADRPGQPG
jgi:transketolase